MTNPNILFCFHTQQTYYSYSLHTKPPLTVWFGKYLSNIVFLPNIESSEHVWVFFFRIFFFHFEHEFDLRISFCPLYRRSSTQHNRKLCRIFLPTVSLGLCSVNRSQNKGCTYVLCIMPTNPENCKIRGPNEHQISNHVCSRPNMLKDNPHPLCMVPLCLYHQFVTVPTRFLIDLWHSCCIVCGAPLYSNNNR